MKKLHQQYFSKSIIFFICIAILSLFHCYDKKITKNIRSNRAMPLHNKISSQCLSISHLHRSRSFTLKKKSSNNDFCQEKIQHKKQTKTSLHDDYDLYVNTFADNSEAKKIAYQKIVALITRKHSELNAQDNKGNSLLHKACDEGEGKVEIISFLLKQHAQCNIKNQLGQTPLHLAVMNQQVSVVQQLIIHPVDLNLQDNQKETALHYACKNFNFSIIHLLLDNNAICTIKNNKKLTSFDYFCNNFHEVIQKDFDTFFQKEFNPFFYTDLEDRKKMLNTIKTILKILEKMIMPSMKKIPLKLFRNVDNNFKSIESNAKDILDLLKILINYESKEYYLGIGYDFYITYSLDQIFFNFIQLKIMREIGIGVNAQDEHLNTMLHKACAEKSLLQICILSLYNADWMIQNNLKKTPLHCLYQNNIHIESLTNHYDEVMIFNVLTIMLLQDKKYNAKNYCNNPVFDYVCRGGGPNRKKLLVDTEFKKCLLSMKDKTGSTLLHYAYDQKHTTIATFLMANGVLIDILNSS